jgi:hypothetical protein
MTLEDIYRAAIQLPPDQQSALIERLQRHRSTVPHEPLTREKLIVELERRRASGAFKQSDNLMNKYYNPAVDDLTDEQLRADIHEFSTEWKKELDEYGSDDNV